MESTISSAGPVLVVGGCGSLGRAIVQDLQHISHVPTSQIHVFDISALPAGEQSPGVTYHQGDVSDLGAVQAVISSVKPIVIFLVVSPHPLSGTTDLFLKANVTGTKNILSCAKKAGTKALVYTSSSSVVDPGLSDMHEIDESARMFFAPEQQDPYLHSKAVAEMLVRDANDPLSPTAKPGLLTCALRPSTLYGPNDRVFVDPLVENARKGVYNIQIGDGENLYSCIYVENAARAHSLAAEKLLREHTTLERGEDIAPTKRVNGEAFFITDGETWPFWTFNRAVGAAAGYPTDESKIRVLPKWFGLLLGIVVEWIVWVFTFGQGRTTLNYRGVKYSTLVRTFNIAKARERLGYEPFVGIKEGIWRSTAKYRKPASR